MHLCYSSYISKRDKATEGQMQTQTLGLKGIHQTLRSLAGWAAREVALAELRSAGVAYVETEAGGFIKIHRTREGYVVEDWPEDEV